MSLNVIKKALYIVSRIAPVLLCHIFSSNINHNFILTMIAEFFMSLDDVGLVSYHTSKIFGGSVFAFEKLLSYSAYNMFLEILIWPIILLFVVSMLKYYPKTEITNIIYLIIVIAWSLSCAMIGTPLQILGMLLYTITDFDVAIYDSKIFGIFLLPVYQLGLFLLAIG